MPATVTARVVVLLVLVGCPVMVAVGAVVSKVYEAVAVEQEEVLVAASVWEA